VGARVQELHLVGTTRDLDGLIFSSRKGAKSGSFVVPIDDALLESIQSAARLRREREEEGENGRVPSPVTTLSLSRPESQLTPRDIQARLRAGHSIAQVARAAGVSTEWVERFASPVLAEQARVVETALGLRSVKARLGESALPLAESVRTNLFDKGVLLVPEPGEWSAMNLDGSRWLVRFEYVSRRRAQKADWELDFDARTLTPRNRTATDLGYVDAARSRRPGPPPPAPTPGVPAGGGGRTPAMIRTASAEPETGVEVPPAEAVATSRPAPAEESPVAKKAGVKKAAVKKAAAKKKAGG